MGDGAGDLHICDGWGLRKGSRISLDVESNLKLLLGSLVSGGGIFI